MSVQTTDPTDAAAPAGRTTRYPVPVTVISGPDRGGVTFHDGRAYLSVPDAGRMRGRVVGVVAVTDDGAGTVSVGAIAAEIPMAAVEQVRANAAAGDPAAHSTLVEAGRSGKANFAAMQENLRVATDRERRMLRRQRAADRAAQPHVAVQTPRVLVGP